ncbi:hydantoinase/oxoprolinase family protein [Mumia zhuanghuii]|uniref:Hydantoinase/oxoprolinase family protein n=2 Tax=Mumia TaxID=1546255 RepID=A0ABW1QH94_9ACTN|nr:MULTISPECIES: hydantoinase/oxoprolinase family protein [Mumia]KAA1423009.1 hydantoinase/oxoprolinase family protein [Mumia zhuanghuii]
MTILDTEHGTQPPGSTCIGVDVGGTFTDAILSDGTTVWRAKAPSTPGDLGAGVLDACERVAERAGTTLDALLPSVARFGLGTTAVTNAIASRTGRRLGLVTTQGFEDLVPMARAMRTHVDGWLTTPDSLVDRERIRGVRERVDRTGTVLTALDPADVVAEVQWLVDHHQIEGLTVSFLWSCVNDAHESAAVAAVRERFPDLPLTSGAELLPVVKEFERTQFALLNAYTGGALDGVDTLAAELAARGLRVSPLLVHSGGGSISVAEGRNVPATMAESGPAAGVIAAQAICAATGVSNAVTGDVGGTSFDVSFISDGVASRRSTGELMGIWTALPMIDINSIGTGGGSIGWVDSLNILRVGPRSAGANPGPACYGRGGSEPTVTDALVVLGYIDPAQFLGGTMTLDSDAAMAACETLAGQLGMSAVEAAWGIWEVAKSSMTRALRARFAEQGVDQREFSLITMGGCGALSSAEIAHELGLRGVVVPELASVLSAFGAATSDVRRERSRAVSVLLPDGSDVLAQTAKELADEVRADLAADEVPDEDVTIGLIADVRFFRQHYELQIPWDGGLDEDGQAALVKRFTSEYVSRYGSGAVSTGAPVELVTLRAYGLGATVRASLAQYDDGPGGVPEPSGERLIHLTRGSEPTSVPTVVGDTLQPGHRLTGPAVIDAADTTIWIPETFTATVDSYRNLHLEAAK